MAESRWSWLWPKANSSGTSARPNGEEPQTRKPGRLWLEAARPDKRLSMKARRQPRKPAIRIANLEAGMPTVHEALSRLDQELAAARREKSGIMKLVHGYGSSGTGGDIRVAVQRRLVEMRQSGQIR